MDGFLTISTEIDNSGFDKDLKELNSKIDNESAKQDIIVQKTKEYEQELEKVEAEMSSIAKEMDECSLKLETMKANGQEFSTSYNNAVDKIDELSSKYTGLEAKQSNLNTQIDKQNIKYNEIGTKIQKYKDKVDEIEYQNQVSQLEQIKKLLNNAGNSISKTVKKVGRWAIAIFGVRSAYLAVSKAASTISQYNEQVGADLQYIQYALAMALEPIVKSLINLVYQLLTYVNLIAQAWFNVDLFANSSADKFRKAQKNAEKMRKSLSGFDTANVLSDSSSSSGSGTGTPSYDLSTPEFKDTEPPKWLQTIIDFGKWVIDNWLEVLGLLSLTKLVIDLLTGNWVGVVIDLVLFLITQLPRVWEALQVVWESLKAGWTWLCENAEEVLGTIGNMIGEFFQFLIDGFVNIIKFIGDKFLDFVDWIYNNLVKPVIDFFVFMGGQIWKSISEPIKNIIDFIVSIKDSVLQIWSGIQQILNGDIKGGLKTIFRGLVNIIIDCLNFLIGNLNTIISPIRLLIVGIGKVMGQNWTMDNIKIPKIKKLKNGGIVDLPKTGVPLASNVIAGEAGAEGVFPLTEETYESFGKAIAKYINIDIDLTTKLDSRVLLRILKQIQGEQSFARNGG